MALFQELRDGNCIEIYLRHTGKWEKYVVNYRFFADIRFRQKYFRGCELDHEWIEKFGLTKQYNDKYGKLTSYPYKMLGGIIKQRNGVYLFKKGTLEVELPYVHTLQNLYFALSGVEL